MTFLFDPDTFADADEVVRRFEGLGGDEMIVVAPLTVIHELTKRGLRPIQPVMTKIDASSKPEVTVCRADGRVDGYRFERFRRIMNIEIESEEVVTAATTEEVA